MFSQFRLHGNIENNATTMQRNQSAHTYPFIDLFLTSLFGHLCTKTNLLLINNRLVRLPHRLIQLKNKSPVQNTIYTSRHYFLYPRTVCILIYGAVILDFMESSAILNHQALVKP